MIFRDGRVFRGQSGTTIGVIHFVMIVCLQAAIRHIALDTRIVYGDELIQRCLNFLQTFYSFDEQALSILISCDRNQFPRVSFILIL